MKNLKFKILTFLVGVAALISFYKLVESAPRSSGTRTQCIGSPCETLYRPVASEEEGWGSASTDSINNNWTIIASAIARVELQGTNTNYIQLRNTLQSGATFFVSSASVDGQALFNRASGNTGIGISTAPSHRLLVNGGILSISSITIRDALYSGLSTSVSTLTNVGNLDLFGTIANDDLQTSSITKKGNAFQVSGGNFTIDQGSLTVQNPYGLQIGTMVVVQQGSGNVGIGTVIPTSLLTVTAGSMTFTSNGARVIYNEAAACGKITVLASGSNLIVSSQPATTGSSFVTFDSSVLNATSAKAALLKMQCNVDANLTGTVVAGRVRQTGSGISNDGNASYCQTGPADATYNRNDFDTTWVLLDSSRDFDYACVLTGTAGGVCNVYLNGYCE